MPQAQLNWEEYLAHGWRSAIDRFAGRPIATVLLSYNGLIDKPPRIYPVPGLPDNRVIVACADERVRLVHQSLHPYHIPELQPVVALIQTSYSCHVARCLETFLTTLLGAVPLDQLSICWQLYVGKECLPIERIAAELRAVTPHCNLTIIRCRCVKASRIAPIDGVDSQTEVACGGQMQLTKLVVAMTQPS